MDANERHAVFIETILLAMKATCEHCRRDGPPEVNAMRVLAHRTYSSRGLGTDRHCSAYAITQFLETPVDEVAGLLKDVRE